MMVKTVDIRLHNGHKRVVRHDESLAEDALATVVFVRTRTNLGKPELLALDFRKRLGEVAEALNSVIRAAVRRFRAVRMVDDVGNLIKLSVSLQFHDHLGGGLVVITGGEVGIALDFTSRKHAVSHLG